VLAGRGVSAALSLVTTVVTTRLLAPTDYGHLAYLLLVAWVMYTASASWSSSALTRYGREKIELEDNMAVVTWARLALVIPLLALAAGVVCAIKAVGLFPPEFTWRFTWLAITLAIALAAADHVLYTLQAIGKQKLNAAGAVTQQALSVSALTTIFVVGVDATPAMIATISLSAAFLMATAFSVATWRSAVFPVVFDRRMLQLVTVFALPLVAVFVSQSVIRWVDIVVIRILEPAAQVGLYAVAYQGFIVLLQLAVAVATVLTPLLVSLRVTGRGETVKRFFERFVPQLGLLAATAAGMAAPVVPLLVPIVFGSAFEDAARPLVVLLVAATLLFVNHLLGAILEVYNETRALGATAVVAALVNVVADPPLIALMGVVGAAVATGLAVATITVGYTRRIRRRLSSDGLVHPLLLAPLAPGVAAGLAAPGSPWSLVGTLGAAATAVLVLLVLRPFAAEDAAVLDALDMPTPVRRRLVRAYAFLGR
jgi:O-antigen/teichoic acid export membrane protein